MKAILFVAVILPIAAIHINYLDKGVIKYNGTQRIANGEKPDVSSFMVRITALPVSTDKKKDGYGSLITKRHILTVAALVKGFSAWNIGYGSERLNTLIETRSEFGYIHSLFDETPSPYDIGVIIVPHSLDSATPISLPETLTSLPRTYEEGTVVAFETVNYFETKDDAPLKSAYLSVLTDADCQLDELSFCAAEPNYDANVCSTDVGSAFNVHFRGQYLLAGLLRVPAFWCEIGDRSFFLKIQEFVPWIKAIANL